MQGSLRLDHPNGSEEFQLELLSAWYASNTHENRTLDFFDAIPKYPFSLTTTAITAERIPALFTLRGKKYLAEILPAQIKERKTGQERLVFPGAREELVERALRFIAVQQIAETKLTPDVQTGRRAVTVFFTLSMLRRHLEQLGHGYKLSEIKEALDILSGTMIQISSREEDAPPRRAKTSRGWQRFVKATILSNYAGDFRDDDPTGEESRAAMTFHPLATQAILELAYFPVNHTRVGSLKRPFARWLTTRLNHNFRQATKNGFINGAGYHIALKTILEERGLPPELRLRANVESVRLALKEMKEWHILGEIKPFDEKLIYAPSKGRPKIIDAVWTLYPSSQIVDEIINGNVEMGKRHSQAGNPGMIRLLPGFQDEQVGGNKGESAPFLTRKPLAIKHLKFRPCFLSLSLSLLSPT